MKNVSLKEHGITNFFIKKADSAKKGTEFLWFTLQSFVMKNADTTNLGGLQKRLQNLNRSSAHLE
jgi:hypothetical protein